MEKGIIKIKEAATQIDEFESISLIGDPGCDGLGASTMAVFAKALTCSKSDFSIVLGDIVHKSISPLYSSVKDFVNTVSPNKVYMLCGNHDLIHYEEFFGLRNYLLYNDKTLLLFLDNSKKKFEEHTIEFLRENIEKYKRKNIVIFFHIPPPSAIGENTVKVEEWEKVKILLANYKNNISYIICGHVHSYYEDVVDGFNLIVSGGGGAKIEFLNPKIDTRKAHHHIVRLFFGTDGKLKHEYLPLEAIKYAKETEDELVKSYLENSLANESMAHVRYKLFAEEAEEKRFPGIAKMFRAFSDSEFYHAKNHFYVLGRMNPVLNNLKSAKEGESFEVETMYKEYLDYCKKMNHGLTAYTFYDSLEAEKKHLSLVKDALECYSNGSDIPVINYFTCASCGYTLAGFENPVNCPICGAPNDRINKVL